MDHVLLGVLQEDESIAIGVGLVAAAGDPRGLAGDQVVGFLGEDSVVEVEDSAVEGLLAHGRTRQNNSNAVTAK